MTSNWDFNRMFAKKISKIMAETKQGSPPRKRTNGYSFSLAARNNFNQTFMDQNRSTSHIGPGYYDLEKAMRTTVMSKSPSYSFNREDNTSILRRK